MSLDLALKVAGLAGSVFGRKKKSAQEIAQERVAGKQESVLDKMLAMADSYDPAAETRDSVNYAQRVSSNALQNALRGVTADFKNAGGVPGGDTAHLHLQQRTLDDVLNPLAGFAAQRASQNFASKMAAYGQALGQAPPGQLFGMYNTMAGAGGRDLTGMMGLAGDVLSQVLPQKTPAMDKGSAAGQDISYSGQMGRVPSITGARRPGKEAARRAGVGLARGLM